jgi:uncharacterized protein (TIGR00730 family)
MENNQNGQKSGKLTPEKLTRGGAPKSFRPPLAYRDTEFMDSDDARPLRILSEYVNPQAALRDSKVSDTVVFFGSARIPDEGHALSKYYKEARELARHLTVWSESSCSDCRRFVISSGGGPGIMEAANRGAHDAQGLSIGLNIALPFEQSPNPYITPELNFEFHYFFMRKFWFANLAKAIVVFPGGFGTMDELFELLTLAQTRKLDHKMHILLYGSEFWKEVINFEALKKYGLISPEDLDLFEFVDTPWEAFVNLKKHLTEEVLEQPTPEILPDIAHSRV